MRLPEIQGHKGSLEIQKPVKEIFGGEGVWLFPALLRGSSDESPLQSEPDLSYLLCPCEGEPVCVSALSSLISTAAVWALREGSEGNVAKCGPHDAASFLGGSALRQCHKKHVSSDSVRPVSVAVCHCGLCGFVHGQKRPTGPNNIHTKDQMR